MDVDVMETDSVKDITATAATTVSIQSSQRGLKEVTIAGTLPKNEDLDAALPPQVFPEPVSDDSKTALSIHQLHL